MAYQRSPPNKPVPPRFRIQEAILILREGKSNPLWREAAWHLIEHAHKDTQLLLEAQRDLLERERQVEEPWYRRWLWPMLLCGLSLLFMAILYALWHTKGTWCA